MHEHLRHYVIRPVLEELEQYGVSHIESAEELLILTAAVESDGGKRLRQVGGTALGIYGMGLATVDDLLWTMRKWGLPTLLFDTAEYNEAPVKTKLYREICGNLLVATALARMHYHFAQEHLPDANDVEGLAEHWKQHWNHQGNVMNAITAYKMYIGKLSAPKA